MNMHLKTLAAAAIALGGVNIAYADGCTPRGGFDPVYCAAPGTASTASTDGCVSRLGFDSVSCTAPGTQRNDQPAGTASVASTGACMPRGGFDPVYCAEPAGESGELALSGGAPSPDEPAIP